jgi:phospholipid-binding lipoprotein MlaA
MPPAVRPFSRLRALAAGAAISMTLLGGCATNGDPRDPLEPLNRGIYKFNDGADALLIRPAGEFYSLIVPQWIRSGVSNFFSNLNDVIVVANDLLQGKISQAGSDVARLAINSTVGVLGLFDFATGWGYEKHEEDFGQTLGYWGLGDGPYIVLPILGPSNVRDTVGWVGDFYAWPVTYIEHDRTRRIVVITRIISGRAELLATSSILETAALDPYAFVRDAYLQRRRNLVYDGKPPLDDEDPDPEAKPKPKPDAAPKSADAPKPEPAADKPSPEAAKPDAPR